MSSSVWPGLRCLCDTWLLQDLDPTRPCWIFRQTYKGSLILATVPSTPAPTPQSDFQQSFYQPLGVTEIPMLSSSPLKWPQIRRESMWLSLQAEKRTKCSPQLSKHVSLKTGTWVRRWKKQKLSEPLCHPFPKIC